MSTGQDQPRWVVRFKDGHVMRCSEKALRKMLVHVQGEQVGRQLDYVFISKRWASSIEQCQVRWGPSIHRSVHGFKSDHALLSCRWKWRIRTFKPQPVKDFSVLQPTCDENGIPKPSPDLERFSAAVQEKLTELGHQQADGTDKLYADICSARHGWCTVSRSSRLTP